MEKHLSLTVRPATGRFFDGSNAGAVVWVAEKSAYQADFVRYVKLMSP